MNIGKRFDRMKQWTDERMGKEIKTAASDEFKALELEMQLRHEGMERLQKSMTTYVKSLSKTKEAEDKEKTLPIAYLGSTMASHGDDFEPDSEFGQCLSTLGRANERIARMQESYVSNATNSWLESVERSLAQMKEYQTARKRLETRRLAYDTSMNKLQKAKKDDFTLEESARSQKAKYDESSDDVQRRMLDIKEAEVDSINDLSTFLDAELAYYDRAREILMQCKRDWPSPSGNAGAGLPVPGGRRVPRSRSNTGNSASFRQIDEDEPVHDFRPPIRARAPSGTNSPRRELPGFDLPVRSSNRFEGPSSLNSRDASPVAMPRLSRVPTDSSVSLRQGIRSNKRNDSANSDVFGDQDDYALDNGHNDRYYADEQRSVSPASYSAAPSFSRSASWSQQDGGAKKLAPPPPPSRAKKPPPPPPMKRSALSSSDIPRQY